MVTIYVSSKADEYSDPVFHNTIDCESETLLDNNRTRREYRVPSLIGSVKVPWVDKELRQCESCIDVMASSILFPSTRR